MKTPLSPAGSLARLSPAGAACRNLPESSSQTISNTIFVKAPAVVTGSENSRSLLDWGGKYAGTLALRPLRRH